MVSALIHMMTRPATGKKSDKKVLAKNLPMAARFFVQRNFPNRSIAFAEERLTPKGMMYVATLNDGIQVSFTENGSWEKVDCKMGAVPATVVPATVATYMNAFYPNIPMVKIEKTDDGYEVTLSNYVSLKFNNLEYVA